MYTRFDRRNLYVTHDITSLLQNGKNAIGVILGNGWYNHQSTAVWYFHEAPWRARPTFCMDVRVAYDDGSVETISTGKDWKTSLSPLVFNSIYTAEHMTPFRTGWMEYYYSMILHGQKLFIVPLFKTITAGLHPVKC
jgi:alpha-L-rhamnosidase